MSKAVPDNAYVGELVAYPGAWTFQIGRPHIILVNDQELETLSDPDAELNLSLGHQPHVTSLRKICESAQAAGQRTLIVAYDHFFSQYRPGQDAPRKYTPDMDEYIQRIAGISKFASGYGLKLELSLLSPLEIGPAYRAQTGESGTWLHYRKGLRDPETGQFSVQLWRHKNWANNKGVIELEDAGVRVFAFKETGVGGTFYHAVRPEDIVEVSGAKVEVLPNTKTGVGHRIRVYGEGGPTGYDRVLVVQQYRTPEMDYFSDKALTFLTNLLDKYFEAGVELNAFYSDEMHIQQDWNYFGHHDNGEFALRYVTDSFARRFAKEYGEQYADMAKYMVYFCYGQGDYMSNTSAKLGWQHVFGDTPEAIRETALFRSRYYKMLQDTVVDLFVKARRHAEQRCGYRLYTRAHATWAQSPTIDQWASGRENHSQRKYEYTSDFVWSNTVHQAASACYDYFRWGDYLTGNGNDHAEGGWLDRNYYGLMLACSTGIINEIPYSYGAHWGMPHEIAHRRQALVNVYGAAATPEFMAVEDAQHRDVDVLMLYPMDLVAVEERFGSWMTQYGYANLITQEKLTELGTVTGAAIEMAGRKFTTLVALFEPFPSKKLLDMMQRFAENGGRVIWSGPPPVLTKEGQDALHQWQELFGVDYSPAAEEGKRAPGRIAEFEGPLAGVEPQTILTDFLVDRIYPVIPRDGTQIVTRVKSDVIGTHRALPGGGSATFFGFRPRDDQSASLGYETRTWFEVLSKLGAYPATGKFANVNDNTEHISRNSDYLACRFPNGTVAIAPHLRRLEENWGGGFARDPEKDAEHMAKHPAPSDNLVLTGLKVNGHEVTYNGKGAVAFRIADGKLIAFAGNGCAGITIDGKEWAFFDTPRSAIAFAPVSPDRQVPGDALLQILVRGAGTVRVPLNDLNVSIELAAQGAKPGSRGETVPSKIENGSIVFDVTPALNGRWIYAVPTK